MAKQIQIDRNLFAKIYRYFDEDPAPDDPKADDIRLGLEEKMSRLIAREEYKEILQQKNKNSEN